MAEQREDSHGLTRRSFLQSAAATTGVLLSAPALALGASEKQDAAASAAVTTTTSVENRETTQPGVHPGGKETIRVGVIGAGGRGTGAAINALDASPAVVITAIGDLFEDKALSSLGQLQGHGKERCKATKETCFSGWDNHKKVLDAGVDLVILATPPGFRPMHIRAAIEAGKHVFAEKPVAVDPIGVRSVIESSQMADDRKLCIGAGTQRRHSPVYIETIQRIKDGAIGDIISGECFWCSETLWYHDRKPEWSDMEWQVRNWLYFDWLSGDHIVEQHVHNLDVMNWMMGSPPVRAFGMGGRQVRTDPKFGNIFDHFAIEYEYPDDRRVLSMCRQTAKAGGRVSELVLGTKGTADPSGRIKGQNPYEYEGEGKNVNPLVKEHADLINAIMTGQHYNEGKRVAESTMTAIMGRMSAYTGQTVSWKWIMNASKLDLTPPKYELGPLAVNPVPMPGQMALV